MGVRMFPKPCRWKSRVLVVIMLSGCLTILTGLFGTHLNVFEPTVDPRIVGRQSELDLYIREPRKDSGEEKILNPHPFDFLMNPGQNVCSNGDVFLLIYVHSAVQDFDRRLIIRRTWGNVTQFDLPVKLVFMVGLPSANFTTVGPDLEREFRVYNDIVQENYTDTYRNITYKAVGALKWVSRYCSQATFVLKTDDDAFVNTVSLLKHLDLMSVADPSLSIKTIMCNVWIDKVPRKGKWGVEPSVFSPQYYPMFCQGLAYILSMDLVEPLLNASHYVPFLSMDDVFMTGFAVLRLGDVRHVEMNSFFVVNNKELETKLNGEDWSICLFSHIQDVDTIERLWDAVKVSAMLQEILSLQSIL